MRNGIRRKLRADLRQVRQDILIKIEEQETSFLHAEKKEEIKEETTPAHLESIAKLMLDELGGGEFRMMLKGEQTLAQRVAELAEEKQRMLHLRW